jgi:hypothetical protein
MTLRKALITTAVIFFIVPAVPALAHDDDDYGYSGHQQYHDQLSEAHERAHEQGFWSRAEHRAYHRALRDMHRSYHDDSDGGQSYYYARPRYYYRSYGGWW